MPGTPDNTRKVNQTSGRAFFLRPSACNTHFQDVKKQLEPFRATRVDGCQMDVKWLSERRNS